MAGFRRRGERRDDRERRHEAREWTPKTALGRKVQSGEITSFDQIASSGARILEPEIVDALVPDLREDVLEIKSTQRMSAYGRKMKMRAVVVMGNGTGFIAVGVGKAAETRDAISEAIKDAKKKLVKVQLGCSSWECSCGTPHSVTRATQGKSASTQIFLKPAPRGVGIVANETAKKVLELAGVKDVWSFAKGRTRNKLNMVLATIDALGKLNVLKQGVDSQEEGVEKPSSASEAAESGEAQAA